MSLTCEWTLDELAGHLTGLAGTGKRRVLYCHSTVFLALAARVAVHAARLPAETGSAALLTGVDVITGQGDGPGGWRLLSADRKSVLWRGQLPGYLTFEYAGPGPEVLT